MVDKPFNKKIVRGSEKDFCRNCCEKEVVEKENKLICKSCGSYKDYSRFTTN